MIFEKPDMTLDQVLSHLPDSHAAKKELNELRAELLRLKGEDKCKHSWRQQEPKSDRLAEYVCDKCGVYQT